MKPPVLVILACAVNRAVTQGFVPTAIRMGYHVVLLSSYAEDYQTHFHSVDYSLLSIHQIDTSHPILVIDLILNLQLSPKVVMSNSDHIQATTALVADYFQCPSKQWNICYAAKNKAAMRNRLVSQGLPTPWFFELTNKGQIPQSIPFPIVAKPREGVASLNVQVCQNQDELDEFCAHYDWSTALLLEEFMEGELFSIETLSDEEQIQVIGGFDVTLSAWPYCYETAAHWNGNNVQTHKDEALRQLKLFGIGLGVCHSEFIATGNGPVLVEINYRSIGDGSEFFIYRLADFDWFETIINLHAGKKLPQLEFNYRYGHLHYVNTNKSGTLAAQPSLLHTPEKSNCNLMSLKELGEQISITNSNRDYLALLMTWGNEESQLQVDTSKLLSNIHWEVAE